MFLLNLGVWEEKHEFISREFFHFRWSGELSWFSYVLDEIFSGLLIRFEGHFLLDFLFYVEVGNDFAQTSNQINLMFEDSDLLQISIGDV
jgi:hypothetical protein